MVEEGEGATEQAIIVEPGGKPDPVEPPAPDAQGTNLGLLVLFALLLAGIMASNRWLRKRAERADS